MSTPYETIVGVGRPARDALRLAGYPNLECLDGADYAELAALHGVGKRGLERLHAALVDRGLGLAGQVPARGARQATITDENTGKYTADIKTRPGGQNPVEYVEELETPRRVAHGRLLLELFGRATGEHPVMWGPSMIGFGEVHYKYATGREGDTFRVGFSPRKAKISLYGLTGFSGASQQLARLGKHTSGVARLYINKPEDIDLTVLEKMIRHAWEHVPSGHC